MSSISPPTKHSQSYILWQVLKHRHAIDVMVGDADVLGPPDPSELAEYEQALAYWEGLLLGAKLVEQAGANIDKALEQLLGLLEGDQ